VESDAAMAAEAESLLEGVDTAVVVAGPLEEGVAAHGPYDAMIVEGAVEVLPAALEAQLKPGGRIAAIFVEGARGHARLGRRTETGIAWRRIFDATAPVLPGFAAAKAFEF
jgi:protein-L-isoaspartate(D-aspartate) O-methyltransferase